MNGFLQISTTKAVIVRANTAVTRYLLLSTMFEKPILATLATKAFRCGDEYEVFVLKTFLI